MELTDNDLLSIELRANRYSFAAQADILDLLKHHRALKREVEMLEEEVETLQNDIEDMDLPLG